MSEQISRPASGTQYVISNGPGTAIITELAAGLREYTVGGVHVTEGYGEETISPGASGVLLAPWANRVRDGIWHLNGKIQQLDITEVSRNNASHGLLRNASYRLVERGESFVELESVIFPQHGYPFLSRHVARYELDAAGALTVRQTFHNDSADQAPVVLGAHPYLRIGDVPAEELSVRVPAGSYLESDERLIPLGTHEVTPAQDLRTGVVIASFETDTAYTQLERDTDGLARTLLTADDGRTVALWQDASAAFVHIFVTSGFPGRAKALAVEPMTGPADAFNSGDGLTWVAPGESLSMVWGITASW